MKLADLPMTFLEHAVKTNPNAQSFPWNINGQDVSRKEIIDELNRRGADYQQEAKQLAILERQKAEREALFKRRGLLAHEGEIKLANLSAELKLIHQQAAPSFVPADDTVQSNITVIIFTSSIPSHPHDYVIKKVYDSIRHQLPHVRVLILADGNDEGSSSSYTQFKNNIINTGWEVIVFDRKMHQSLMLREALLTPGLIATPLIMVAEHDWGIRQSYVDWQGITQVLLDSTNKINLIQLRQDELGSWESIYATFGSLLESHGIRLLPTTLFQCPVHIARCDWYRSLMPFLHRPDFLERDELGEALDSTEKIHEMACYIPNGPMRRLYHLDGRKIVCPEHMDGAEN